MSKHKNGLYEVDYGLEFHQDRSCNSWDRCEGGFWDVWTYTPLVPNLGFADALDKLALPEEYLT